MPLEHLDPSLRGEARRLGRGLIRPHDRHDAIAIPDVVVVATVRRRGGRDLAVEGEGGRGLRRDHVLEAVRLGHANEVARTDLQALVDREELVHGDLGVFGTGVAVIVGKDVARTPRCSISVQR